MRECMKTQTYSDSKNPLPDLSETCQHCFRNGCVWRYWPLGSFDGKSLSIWHWQLELWTRFSLLNVKQTHNFFETSKYRWEFWVCLVRSFATPQLLIIVHLCKYTTYSRGKQQNIIYWTLTNTTCLNSFNRFIRFAL